MREASPLHCSFLDSKSDLYMNGSVSAFTAWIHYRPLNLGLGANSVPGLASALGIAEES